MCGRYRLKDPKRAFDWLEVAPTFDFLPRFNIAPTQRVPVVPAKGRVELMQWGIVPVWAKESAKTLINARSESVREARSFKASFEQRRCLLAADGFYEWARIGKRPHLVTLNGGAPFGIAAIWERGRDNSCCCLLTTSANSVLEPIHNRMPVIVRREDWDEWLSPGRLADESFRRITAPYLAGEVSVLEVSPLVNNATVDEPRCCEPGDAGSGEASRKLKMIRKKPVNEDGQQTFGF